jgi:hypothetical protein
MDKVVISVVMVVCNVDRFLSQSIESILDQSFREFEFIIVDFGSTDRSNSIISSYVTKDKRIKLHVIPHCGLAEARNAGCSLAQGRYIAVMDADDIAVRDRLKWQVNFMEKHPEVGVVGGAIEFIDATGNVLEKMSYPLEDGQIKSALLQYSPFCQPTVLIRKEDFVSAGGYRAAFASAEDYDLWLRMAELRQMANLGSVVLRYRVHSSQVSQRKLTQQALCALAARASAESRRSKNLDPLNSVREITPAVLTGMGVSEAALQQAQAAGYLFWIRNMSRTGEYSAALGLANEMLGSSRWEHAERRVIADIQFATAGLLWRQGRFLRSLLAAGCAIGERPALLGRPLKKLLRMLKVKRKNDRDTSIVS